MVKTNVSNSNKNNTPTMTFDKIISGQGLGDGIKGLEIPKSKDGKAKCGTLCSVFQFILLVAVLVMVTFMLASYASRLMYQVNNVESSVEINIDYPETLKFPAVTVCNMYNGIQKSKYCRAFPNKCENNTIKNLDEEIFKEDISLEKRLRYLQTADDFVEAPYSQNIMIDNEAIVVEPSNFTRIYFEPMINCFTLFAKWNRKTEQEILGGEDSALFLALNFQPDDQVSSQELFINPKAGFVYIHDANNLPDIYFLSGVEVAPNEAVSISLEKKVHHRLPPPYATKCRDYNDQDSDNGSNMPFSQKQCFSECVYKKFMDTCGCIPVYFPQISMKHRVECQYESPLKGNCFERVDREVKDSCHNSCPLSCEEEEYTVKVTRTPIAIEMQGLLDNTSAYVSIDFGSTKRVNYYHVPVQDLYNGRDISLFLLWLLVEITLLIQLIRAMIRFCCRPNEKTAITTNLQAVQVEAVAVAAAKTETVKTNGEVKETQ